MATRKAPIQKFGTQVAPPRKVMIYRCGDKHDKGKQFLIKNFRNLAQLERKVATDIGFLPTLRGLFTLEGKKIADLDEIEDKSVLIAVRSGEIYSPERLPSVLQG